jgi:hypothetical protein
VFRGVLREGPKQGERETNRASDAPYLVTMAAVEDKKALQVRVNTLSKEGKLVELTGLLEEHPEVNVDGCEDWNGMWPLYCASTDTLNAHSCLLTTRQM